MDMNLRNKKIIILAGSTGMGFEITKNLVNEGAKVVFCSSNENNLKRAISLLGNPINLKGELCDLSSTNSIKNFFEKAKEYLENFDGMVYNTGGPKTGNINSLSEEDYYYAYKLLSESAFVSTKEFLKYANKGASVVYMTSTAVKEPIYNLLLSNTMRLTVIGLAKSLSREYSDFARFNVVMPGYILTEKLKQLLEEEAKEKATTFDSIVSQYIKEIPMKRLGDPKEVANLVLFLLSDLSSYINGVAIAVDGGMLKSML
ncbi:SDR family oxidoreductase [Fervidicoccus fontis]|uniref:Short-chain dehydrogenase/reductase SDR n=2 Tax=Fervidicoccus fontis TaxID=683846 RepID=I0A088_FERFK|nr:SDR family oxidoreductase [Fervidicoccus fontis]AFH42395.1 short-chain dehydrogenase/reductase SDR [Fervidicoccus fontis Kam940]MBE9391678.1 SDR family oxidoreductase [Fervidicoccus fontis]PMB76107.1 MAG: short chain dehydrogenase [Fervidicoccus fontis]HEW64396.1 SDR family oxidoreductase [Fervidicoccus fontis]